MRIVAFLIDHLKRSFSTQSQEVYFSLEQLSQVPDLSKRLIIVIGSSLEPGVIVSGYLSSLAVSHLEMIEPLMLALLRERQQDLMLIINQTNRIACSYELNCSLSDPKIPMMRQRALRKMRSRLSYLKSAFNIPVFIIEK